MSSQTYKDGVISSDPRSDCAFTSRHTSFKSYAEKDHRNLICRRGKALLSLGEVRFSLKWALKRAERVSRTSLPRTSARVEPSALNRGPPKPTRIIGAATSPLRPRGPSLKPLKGRPKNVADRYARLRWAPPARSGSIDPMDISLVTGPHGPPASVRETRKA